MKLKIVTPQDTVLEKDYITKVTIETTEGVYGLLPKRLDCAAALVPGILTFMTREGNEEYVGLDRGLFVKVGETIKIATHQAVYSKKLGQLKKSWEKSLEEYRTKEKKAHAMLKALEDRLSLQEFRQ